MITAKVSHASSVSPSVSPFVVTSSEGSSSTGVQSISAGPLGIVAYRAFYEGRQIGDDTYPSPATALAALRLHIQANHTTL